MLCVLDLNYCTAICCLGWLYICIEFTSLTFDCHHGKHASLIFLPNFSCICIVFATISTTCIWNDFKVYISVWQCLSDFGFIFIVQLSMFTFLIALILWYKYFMLKANYMWCMLWLQGVNVCLSVFIGLWLPFMVIFVVV